MTSKSLIGCLCLVVMVLGCRPQPRPLENWEKREHTYTDKTPEEWIKILRHRSPQARRKAVDALIQYGPQTVPALIKVLQDKKLGGSRLSAARALGGIGPDAKAAVPALIDAMRESDWKDRDGAAEALGDIAQRLHKTIPALVEAMGRDDDERVRGMAARALGRIRTDNTRAISALAAALEDPDVNVRAEAAEALQHIGPKAKTAVPALEKAARAEDFIVSQAAGEALKAVRGP